MHLKLQFLARARLWSEVVVSGGEAVFVPTTDVVPPGTPVTVEVSAPELDAPIVVNAVVKQVRTFTATTPAGVLVKVDAASLEKVKAVVAQHDDDARVAGRAEKRVDCDLGARVLSPSPMAACAVKSLSKSGVTLKTPTALVKDAPLSFAVTLPGGHEVMLTAVVMWSRPELALSGLKLTQVDEATGQALEAAVNALSKSTPPKGLTSVGRLVVLADDDLSILDFTSRVITKAGHRVLRAERGDLALELIRKEKPDLVLLDVLMPGLDGLEVCKAIRADASLEHLQVVMLSAMAETKIAQAAASCGADGYMVKPMQLDAVRAMLAERLKPR